MTQEQKPREPLDEKDAEIERLRGMLAYIVRCLRGSDFAACDQDYVASLVSYIEKRIPPVEISEALVSEQTMERLYDAVQEAQEKCTCTYQHARCSVGTDLLGKQMEAHMALLNAMTENKVALAQRFADAVIAYQKHVEQKLVCQSGAKGEGNATRGSND
jgi:hypothetical protein